MMEKTEGIFVECRTVNVNTTTIRGIQYIVCSFFEGDEPVDDKIETLILDAFAASTAEEITDESLADMV